MWAYNGTGRASMERKTQGAEVQMLRLREGNTGNGYTEGIRGEKKMIPTRPRNLNPCEDCDCECNQAGCRDDGWNEGFDTAIKYLNEPCTEHPQIVDFSFTIEGYYPHRYLCPECRKEIGLE